MKRAIILALGAMLMLVVTGCEDNAKTEQPTQAPAATQPAIADEDLAVPADFEDEAARTITVASYKAELDTLETELN
jgi:hypothetical protein